MTYNQEKDRLNALDCYSMDDLRSIVRILRSAEGCEWDREQTHASLRSCLVNETNEVIEAIDGSDSASLKEELGDLLLQIVFHAAIAEEEGAFAWEDVLEEVCKKMLFRHPHVFKGEDKPDWSAIKALEKELRRSGKW